MAVSADDVRQIAVLARLRPDPEAIERLTEELNRILDHIRVLERLDLPDADEPGSAAEGAIRFRDPDLPPDALLGGAPSTAAPHWEDGFFVVPRLPALDDDRPEEDPTREDSGGEDDLPPGEQGASP